MKGKGGRGLTYLRIVRDETFKKYMNLPSCKKERKKERKQESKKERKERKKERKQESNIALNALLSEFFRKFTL